MVVTLASSSCFNPEAVWPAVSCSLRYQEISRNLCRLVQAQQFKERGNRRKESEKGRTWIVLLWSLWQLWFSLHLTLPKCSGDKKEPECRPGRMVLCEQGVEGSLNPVQSLCNLLNAMEKGSVWDLLLLTSSTVWAGEGREAHRQCGFGTVCHTHVCMLCGLLEDNSSFPLILDMVSLFQAYLVALAWMDDLALYNLPWLTLCTFHWAKWSNLNTLWAFNRKCVKASWSIIWYLHSYCMSPLQILYLLNKPDCRMK